MSTDLRVGLCLEPLDTLFFRDGRPFDAANRVSGGLPHPQPLAGALRTALLARHDFRFDHLWRDLRGQPVVPAAQLRDLLSHYLDPKHHWILDTRFRGPWLALDGEKSPVEPLLPVPRTLARVKGKKGAPERWFRTDPLKGAVPNWLRPDPNLLPLWRTEERDAKHPGGFLTLSGINRFLDGGVPTDDDWFEPEDLYGFDARTGIGIDMATLTSAESQIYGIRFLSLRRQVVKQGPWKAKRITFYAEVLPPTGAPSDVAGLLTEPVPFGGEGRYVTVRPPAAPVSWPPRRENVPGSLWLLATPAFFQDSNGKDLWRPDRIPPGRLRAAASDTPLAVSGWDVARSGPKPTRFAVPAGSVYFVEGNLSLNADSLCADGEDVAQGWGFALQGVWNP